MNEFDLFYLKSQSLSTYATLAFVFQHSPSRDLAFVFESVVCGDSLRLQEQASATYSYIPPLV